LSIQSEYEEALYEIAEDVEAGLVEDEDLEEVIAETAPTAPWAAGMTKRLKRSVAARGRTVAPVAAAGVLPLELKESAIAAGAAAAAAMGLSKVGKVGGAEKMAIVPSAVGGALSTALVGQNVLKAGGAAALALALARTKFPWETAEGEGMISPFSPMQQLPSGEWVQRQPGVTGYGQPKKRRRRYTFSTNSRIGTILRADAAMSRQMDKLACSLERRGYSVSLKTRKRTKKRRVC
tara:strand:+ start:1504 stop:2211 length:708 start_codon:yes stop_codon:yes gene_type:complete